MSSGLTIGVAVGIPEPYATELREWRHKFGDPMASAIPPHVTLLPPTEVEVADRPLIEKHLQAVAERQWPFDLQLRGTGSFRPVSPVVFVALATGISGCERLEKAVRTGPLDRPRRFNYHPHVTVAHDLPEPMLDRAFSELVDYQARFEVTSFGLFERAEDGVWHAERAFPLLGG